MKNTTVRLFGVLLALLLVATACGSTATTESAAAVDEDIAADEETSDGDHDDEDHGDGDHGDEEEGHGHGHSSVLEVNPELPIPAVEIEVTETDVAGTFVVDVSLENFTITPENIDGDPIDNEGHMHLLIDDVKVERFTDLEHEFVVPEGEHLVEVELNANNHAAYAVDGEPIRAEVTVTGSGEAPVVEAPDVSEAAAMLTATYVDGAVQLDGDERIEVERGEVVMLTVSSDVEEQVHVHGADLFADVAPGEDAVMVFEAVNAGRFEIEFETSGQFIAELIVS